MPSISKQLDKPLGQILVEKNIITQKQLDSALTQQQKETEKYLGQILFEMGVSQNKINTVLDQFNKRRPFGQVLVDLQILTDKQLDEALEKQNKLQELMSRKLLGVLLVELGYTTYDDYMQALSKHFNMPLILLGKFLPQSFLQKAIGEKYAQNNKIVVLENSETKVKVALAEPRQNLIDELQRIFTRLKHKHIEIYLAYPLEIELCLKRLYAPLEGTQSKL
jgi:hypothetical protein